MIISDFLVLTTDLSPKLNVFLQSHGELLPTGVIRILDEQVILLPLAKPFTLEKVRQNLGKAPHSLPIYALLNEEKRLIFGFKLTSQGLVLASN